MSLIQRCANRTTQRTHKRTLLLLAIVTACLLIGSTSVGATTDVAAASVTAAPAAAPVEATATAATPAASPSESESVTAPVAAADLDEFDGVPADSVWNEALRVFVPRDPPAQTHDAGFLDSAIDSLLSAFGMSARSSSNPWSSWIALTVGGLLVGGAVLLGFMQPWKSSSGRRKKREPVDPRTQPLLVELKGKKGRVQSLDWVEKTLERDEDGDEAHEFITAPSRRS